MLYAIFVILFILWLLGYIGPHPFGGSAIHLLLILALVILFIDLIPHGKL